MRKLCIFMMVICCGCAATVSHLDVNRPQDRVKAVDAYLAEFSSFDPVNSKIGKAIHEVLMRMPSQVLTIMMDRRRPVLFIGVYSSGTARFASSGEVVMSDKDIPAFQQGMTLIKISDALEGGSSEAIMGIVAHEIAHRVLDHIRQKHVSCQAEREANRRIKSWGFVKEFTAASKEFGQAKEGHGVAACQD